MEILTRVPDIDREIFLRIKDDNTLLKTCSLSKYTQSLCNDYFWRQRFIEKYGVDLKRANYKKIYLKFRGKNNEYILDWAIRNNYLSLVKEMVTRGVTLDFFNLPEKGGDFRIYKYLLEEIAKEKGYNTVGECIRDDYLLKTAAIDDNLELVKYLIENALIDHNSLAIKEYIHTQGYAALEAAALYGNFEVFKYLFEQLYPDIDEKNEALITAGTERGPTEYIDEDGEVIEYTPEVNSKGKRKIITYLIENGADVHSDNDYILRYAVIRFDLNLTKFLVEHEANIHANNDEALWQIVHTEEADISSYVYTTKEYFPLSNVQELRQLYQHSRMEIIKYLLELGANWRRLENPTHQIYEYRHPSSEVQELIEKYGK